MNIPCKQMYQCPQRTFHSRRNNHNEKQLSWQSNFRQHHDKLEKDAKRSPVTKDKYENTELRPK